MKVLVTGATGFVGTALLQRLSSEVGCGVRACVRNSGALLGPGIERTVVPDMGPESQWQDALAGCDVVVHLAARVHVMQEKNADSLAEFRRVNTGGTVNLARQAALAGVQRLVFVSSIKVNGEVTAPGCAFKPDDRSDPQDAYAVSKDEAEIALRELAAASVGQTGVGMEVVIVRPPLVYGPGVKGNLSSLLRALCGRVPLPLGAIHNQRSFIALANLVDFLVHCMRHPMAGNQTFLASDGQDLSTTELVQRLASALEKPARLINVSPWLLKLCATAFGKHAEAQRLCGNLQLDISKTRDLLGWVPPMNIDDGLRMTVTGYLDDHRKS